MPYYDQQEQEDDENEITVSTGREGSGSDVEIKKGVDITDLGEEITNTFENIVEAWEENTDDIIPVVISANDGAEHIEESLHDLGLAIDLQVNNLTDKEADEIVLYLEDALGDDYDVIYENYGTNHDHIHLEYDPKSSPIPDPSDFPEIIDFGPFDFYGYFI